MSEMKLIMENWRILKENPQQHYVNTDTDFPKKNTPFVFIPDRGISYITNAEGSMSTVIELSQNMRKALKEDIQSGRIQNYQASA